MSLLHTPSMTVRSYPAGGGLHAHGHAQAVLPLQGAMALAVGERGADDGAVCEGVVQDGVGVLIPAGLLHRFGASGPNRFVVLDFDCAASAGRFFTLDRSLSHLLHYIHDIAGPAREAQLAPEVQRHATALLCDAVLSRTLLQPAPRLSAELQQALALMQQRFAEPLRVADVAAAVGLSASHLHAEFRRQLGKSPARHLADLRLDAAVAQLRGGTAPIAQIALRCGYSEQSALNRALRQRLGTTPAALRRS
ncbi:AraC family transcriptional regulator [Aquabacterium sp.]|uniref:AraC family transcriptional regulator n=1 Tax=Aquabacterium sp. TaxID=1872578 RepID=UPI002C06A865|nr:AraC family transcriptional regulator [Aquabacterium sp.]HSW08485.1 AraC family transcriptional regulator [Aquabacterium sp.]